MSLTTNVQLLQWLHGKQQPNMSTINFGGMLDVQTGSDHYFLNSDPYPTKTPELDGIRIRNPAF